LWVDDDPARALAFLAVAGSPPLLIEELHPVLRRLRERPQPKAGVYFFGAEGGTAGDDTEAVWGDALGDLGALVLDGLDGALSAIDAAVGSGGGGGY
jgi:hypothetical protein